jgi:hypothetical protein
LYFQFVAIDDTQDKEQRKQEFEDFSKSSRYLLGGLFE